MSRVGEAVASDHTHERVDRPRGQFCHTNWTGRRGTTAPTTYNV
jgi:6-phosphogluconate dehydrogenase